MNPQQQALCEAMDAGRAFSWIKGRDVQKGVYLKYTQAFFHTYRMGA